MYTFDLIEIFNLCRTDLAMYVLSLSSYGKFICKYNASVYYFYSVNIYFSLKFIALIV